MEPVTHFLTGACLGRAGLNRTTAYATLATTLAAEAPDMDVLWSVRGPVTSFAHHRGVTHTILGAPFMAAAVTLVVYGIHAAILGHARRAKTSPGASARQGPPARWGYIWLCALIADFSHILLDYTNNYGIRPFFPFNPHWYSRDIVFIVDPILLLALVLGLVLPSIFGLVDSEMSRRRPLFRGRGLAMAALVAMVLIWVVRNAEHAHAIELASNAPPTREPLLRVAAEPYPLDPFHWRIIAETRNAYENADVETLGDRLDWDPDVIEKPPVTSAVAAAKQSYLGRVYENWSTWPLTTDVGAMPAPGNGVAVPELGWHTVQFADMRFSYLHLGSTDRRAPTLAGWVYVGPGNEIEGQIMSGREQR
jgi:inner membrane protein